MLFLLVFYTDVIGMVDWAWARTAGLLWLITFCHLILIMACCLIFFSHFSCVFVWSGWWYRWFGQHWVREKNDSMFCCTIIDGVRTRMKVERENLFSKADLSKQKWNGPVSCSLLSCFGTCPLEEGQGGAGICILVVCQKITVTCMTQVIVIFWQTPSTQ